MIRPLPLLAMSLLIASCTKEREPERPDNRQAASLDEAEAMLDEEAAVEAPGHGSDQ